MFVYNTTVYSTTNDQPYELVYGFFEIVPHSLSRSPTTRYNYDDYASELKQKLREFHKVAHDNIVASKKMSKGTYDDNKCQVNVQVEDNVWIKNHQQKEKLGPK